jgi:hypothetical protein
MSATKTANSDRPAIDGVSNVSTGASQGAAFGQLADASLPPGSCGMILWTLDAQSPVAIFRAIAGGGADLAPDGLQRSFRLDAAEGVSRYGIFERQEFIAEDGARLDVSIEYGLGFDTGIYIERGLITYLKQDGWRSVAPVAGLAGCRAKQ